MYYSFIIETFSNICFINSINIDLTAFARMYMLVITLVGLEYYFQQIILFLVYFHRSKSVRNTKKYWVFLHLLTLYKPIETIG